MQSLNTNDLLFYFTAIDMDISDLLDCVVKDKKKLDEQKECEHEMMTNEVTGVLTAFNIYNV